MKEPVLQNVIPAKAGIQRPFEKRTCYMVFIMKQFFVYILCSKQNGTLYTGVTSDLIKRVYEHRNNLAVGFTKKYSVHRLVWYEMHGAAETAIPREKQIKKWNRKWKLHLIEQVNPEWKDLYDELLNIPGFPPARE
jgi:putative endonuclease